MVIMGVIGQRRLCCCVYAVLFPIRNASIGTLARDLPYQDMASSSKRANCNIEMKILSSLLLLACALDAKRVVVHDNGSAQNASSSSSVPLLQMLLLLLPRLLLPLLLRLFVLLFFVVFLFFL